MENTRKMRLVMSLSTNYSTWPMGGMLTYIQNIIPTFDKRFNLDLWGVSVKDQDEKYPIIREKKYNVFAYAKVIQDRKIPLNFMRVFIGMFRNAMKLQKYDLIFCHSAIELIAIKFRLGKKSPFIIYIQHGLSYLTTERKILHFYDKILGHYAHLHSNMNFIVTDKNSFEDFVKRPENKLASPFFITGSPVNVNSQINVKKCIIDEVKFIYTGRLSKEKQPDIAIRSFAKYHDSFNHRSSFTLIGDGRMMNELKELVNQLHIDDCVKFLGSLQHDDVLYRLSEYHIFLIPSMGEGVSVSTVEALAAGIPVVAFNVTGMRGLIQNNRNGYLVEYNDIVKFADGMNKTVKNYSYLSIQAHKSVHKYDSKILSEYMSDIILENYYKYINKNIV